MRDTPSQASSLALLSILIASAPFYDGDRVKAHQPRGKIGRRDDCVCQRYWHGPLVSERLSRIDNQTARLKNGRFEARQKENGHHGADRPGYRVEQKRLDNHTPDQTPALVAYRRQHGEL